MSHPSIYIALRGKTRHVPPRYIRPRPPAPARARDPRSREYMVRYSGTPIPHTEFGIRESEIRNRGTGNLHGAVFSLLTLMDMVR
jgi:hypothetical protein